ncbi:MAG: hypothetical protein JNL72_08455 [Flavipsychrobacter sp.]|nr:hypothetical protein [Flavipsychrobacter sp.]
MKGALLISIVLLSFSSCKKLATKHHCVCRVIRTTGAITEDLGTVEKNQLGTYATAKDTCNKLQEKYTYTTQKSTGTETYTATCELN